MFPLCYTVRINTKQCSILLIVLAVGLALTPRAFAETRTTEELASQLKGLVKEYVRLSARAHGIHEEMAVALAGFESGFDPYAKNPASTAKGVFQFLDSTFQKFCTGEAFDAVDNTICAMKIIASSPHGISHWTADKYTRAILLAGGYVVCAEGAENMCRTIPKESMARR